MKLNTLVNSANSAYNFCRKDLSFLHLSKIATHLATDNLSCKLLPLLRFRLYYIINQCESQVDFDFNGLKSHFVVLAV